MFVADEKIKPHPEGNIRDLTEPERDWEHDWECDTVIVTLTT